MKAEQLRKSILQLAIQGKLVPQDPNDEPASVLLERIRTEKQRLIKEGKIKKDKNDSVIFKGEDNRYYEKVGKEIVCIDEEVADFDTPDSWCLCRMSTIANVYTGNSINETEKQRKYVGLSNGYNYIATKDVSFEHAINYENGVKIPFSEINFKVAYKNTPLLCIEGGSAGRKIAILEQDVCFGNKLCAFQSLGVNPKYLYYYLQNPLFIQVFKSKTTGIIGGVSVNTLKTLIFALPPLAEQIRIVAEIEKFEPLIAEYDKLEQQATKLDDEIYDKLKKSILQYAIQGKLVPQDPNDEPASVLLERISAEKKAKLGKKFVDSYIYKGDDNCYYEHIGDKVINITEEIPFDLPTWWEWARLNDLCFEISDIDHKMPKAVERGVLFLSAKDLLNDGTINYTHNVKYISEEDYNKLSTKSKPQKGDIIYSRIGACLGKARIVKKDIKFLVSYSCCTIKPLLINTEYLRCILDDVFVLNQAKKKTQSIGVPDLGIAEIKKFRIPIPPLSEQKRIVAKINEIFAML